MALRAPGLGTNAVALMLSSTITGVLGLGFWWLAEHCFETADVGRASAAIAAATALGTISCLSLGGTYERFLADGGRHTRRYVLLGVGAVVVVALIVGSVFTMLGFADRLVEGPGLWLFPPMVAIFAVFALVDPVCVGLGRATWAAAKNVAAAMLKLAPLYVLAGAGSWAISGSWTAVSGVTAALTLVLVLTSRTVRTRTAEPALPPVRDLVAFQGASFTLMVVGTAVPLVLPIVVIHAVGAEQTAYFNLSWQLCTAVGMLYAAVLSAYVSSAAGDVGRAGEATRRTARILAAVALVGGSGLAVVGPLMLGFVSPAYAAEGGPLLRLMAVAFAFQGVLFFYGAMSRVVKKLRLLVVVQVLAAAGIVLGSLWAVPRFGLDGVGLVYVAVEVACVAVVAVPAARVYRRLVAGDVDLRPGAPALPVPPPAVVPAEAPVPGRRP